MLRQLFKITSICLIQISIIGSVLHYHEDGLECIEHALESHLEQSGDYCPLTLVRGHALVAESDPLPGLVVHFSDYNEFITQKPLLEVVLLNSGRSPPYLVVEQIF
ncbi:MAG: hypothetical protein VW868_06520 [Bacteroidota bacterium]